MLFSDVGTMHPCREKKRLKKLTIIAFVGVHEYHTVYYNYHKVTLIFYVKFFQEVIHKN